MINRKIGYVYPGSPADVAGVCAGDELISINGEEFHDILEYRFLASDAQLTLEIAGKGKINITTDYLDPGIEFEDALIDSAKSCTNKCIFCFIDQLPEGMRDTVYFKDDDTRLSFLQGNYVTLTNISDEELKRLIDIRISPINISVHTTNPELRKMMLSNRFAGNIYERMKTLAENNIYMNCQIVLCRNINDGDELSRSLYDLAKLHPYVESVSVVPVGLSGHRDGLYPLSEYDAEAASAVIEQVEKLQEEFLAKLGTRLVYLSDEFYVLSGQKLPEAEEYEGFPQIENGVGLMSSMKEEFDDAIERVGDDIKRKEGLLLTGEAAYEYIKDMADTLNEKFGTRFFTKAIKNDFFGGAVSVSGLIVGSDIIKQVSPDEARGCVFIPSAALRDDDELFLDDTTVDDLRQHFKSSVIDINNDGYDFIEKLLDTELIF